MGTMPYNIFTDLEIFMKNMYDDKDTEQLAAFKDRTMRKEINGWQRVYTYSNKNSGFIAYIYEKNGTPIIVGEGTDFWRDWKDDAADNALRQGEIPAQYYDLEKLAKQFQEMYPGKQVIGTGHSLFGSLLELYGKRHPNANVATFSSYTDGVKNVLRNHPGFNKSDGSNIINFGVKGDPVYGDPSQGPGTNYYIPGKSVWLGNHLPQNYGSIKNAVPVDRGKSPFNQRSRQERPNKLDPHYIPPKPGKASAISNSDEFKATAVKTPLPQWIQNQILEQQAKQAPKPQPAPSKSWWQKLFDWVGDTLKNSLGGDNSGTSGSYVSTSSERYHEKHTSLEFTSGGQNYSYTE